MREFDNNTIPNEHDNVTGLLKGDIKNIEKLSHTIRPEDITIHKFEVKASSLNDLFWICNRIDCKLKIFGLSADKRQNLIIALVEIINNAQQHSYKFAKEKVVVINLFKIGDDYFWIGVESVGEPIPLNKIKSLLNENNPLKIGVRSGHGYIL